MVAVPRLMRFAAALFAVAAVATTLTSVYQAGVNEGRAWRQWTAAATSALEREEGADKKLVAIGREKTKGGFDSDLDVLIAGKAGKTSNANRRCPKTWRKQYTANTSKPLTFGFFNRPGFTALFKEADRRKWTIRQRVEASIPSLEGVDFIFTHPSAYTRYPMLRELEARRHLISAVQGMQAACGSKSTQVRVFREHAESVNCQWDHVQFLPQSFILSDVSLCEQFFGLKELNRWRWILKPSNSYGGAGIEILHGDEDVAELRRRFMPCRRWQLGMRDDNRYIIQRYVERPLLLNGKKFDIRVYMLLASTQPVMLLYRPGYIRASLHDYSLNSTKDLSRHLTNTHVQEAGELNFNGVAGRHFWSLRQFQEYLSKHVPEKGDGFVKNTLEPFVKNASLYLFHSGRSKIIRSPGTFQLVGLDIMVDEKMACWFIEANNYPLWPFQGQFSMDMSLSMAKDLYDLILSIHTDHRRYRRSKPGDMISSFELLYSEMDDCRQKKAARFDPCLVFPRGNG